MDNTTVENSYHTCIPETLGHPRVPAYDVGILPGSYRILLSPSIVSRVIESCDLITEGRLVFNNDRVQLCCRECLFNALE